MHVIFSTSATPTTAFFEGFVRIFDWWSLFLTLRRKQKRIFFDRQDDDDNSSRNRQIVDRYVRESISAFEREEADNISDAPFLPRRVSVAADTQLGTMSSEDVIIHYEGVVPGAVERIMGAASDRFKEDSEAELEHFGNLCRQGCRGMVAGFILTMLLSCGAIFLLFNGVLWAGLLLVGANFALGACATAYVSLGGLRERWFTGEFFPKVFYPQYKYRLNGSHRYRRPSL